MNARAARLAGLPVQTVRMFAYAFSGLCAGLAGLIVTADIHLADVSNAGQYAELDAILAAVIGGTAMTGGKARLVGSILGALLLQTVTIMLQMHHVPTSTALVGALVFWPSAPQTPAFAALPGDRGKGPPHDPQPATSSVAGGAGVYLLLTLAAPSAMTGSSVPGVFVHFLRTTPPGASWRWA